MYWEIERMTGATFGFLLVGLKPVDLAILFGSTSGASIELSLRRGCAGVGSGVAAFCCGLKPVDDPDHISRTKHRA